MNFCTHLLPCPGLAIGSVTVAVSGLLLGFQARQAMPNRIDVGTHHLRTLTLGTGSPTVVFETYGGAPLEVWNRIGRDAAALSSVFCYDHGGFWGSEPGPKPRDARRIAAELRTALDAARLPPPYLLVGYSFGGPYTRVFADLYPADVAGMVLVDPTQETFILWLREHFPGVNTVTGADRAREEEWGCQDESMQQAAKARVPPVPITLISATSMPNVIARNLVPRFRKAHENWLASIPGARHVVADQSEHGIVFTHPEIVVDEIRRMIAEVRQSTREPAAAGGRVHRQDSEP